MASHSYVQKRGSDQSFTEQFSVPIYTDSVNCVAKRTRVFLVLSILVMGPLSGQEKDWEPVDVVLETLAILKLDADFSAAARDKDLERFVVHLATNSWLIGSPSAYTPRGFINAWSDLLFDQGSGSNFRREPRDATVALSGDLAVSFGSYELSVSGQEDVVGEYVTVWRRDEGRWKVAVNAPIVNWDPSLATLEVRTTRSQEHVWLVGDPNRVTEDGPATLREAAFGDLAYALGEYWTVLSKDDGTKDVATGYYLSIWEREAHENWKLSWESFPPPRQRSTARDGG